MPTSEDDWKNVTEQFYLKWNFPNCLGVLDRRHIKFRPSHSSGSYFFNYKGNHSIVLLGLIDAQYKFLYVNVEVNCRINNGGVFRERFLLQAIANNSVNFPPAKALPESLDFIVRQAGNRNSNSAGSVLEEFKDFFNGGWQNNQIARHNM
ncbi:hypothetical protein ILUMI_13719 [Ignelater luminosus]|uniref:DDE Tnp4 domain-containing protein n=1 Tax=Ignelater luminosus TaxID=2038154 RepID=A0A8K0GAN0_IGNLU|nr:hypothetical protein ILUMI_13719 [Ignelater luminosus]